MFGGLVKNGVIKLIKKNRNDKQKGGELDDMTTGEFVLSLIIIAIILLLFFYVAEKIWNELLVEKVPGIGKLDGLWDIVRLWFLSQLLFN
tara:strand:- start:1273 stop:1542 length:270 start_codon:yes stop_codon:yes gene_type:complete